MNTRYNGVLSAYNTHRKTCDSVGIPYSTDTALLRVVNDILSYMNKQHVPIVVLLDLTAAFDTVDHAILLHQVKTSLGSRTLLLHGSHRIYLDVASACK